MFNAQKKVVFYLIIIVFPFALGLAAGYYMPGPRGISPDPQEEISEIVESYRQEKALEIKAGHEDSYLNGKITFVNRREDPVEMGLFSPVHLEERFQDPPSSPANPVILIERHTLIQAVEEASDPTAEPKQIGLDDLQVGNLVTVDVMESITDIMYREDPYTATRITKPDKHLD